MPDQKFEAGERVKYLGNTYPHLTGKAGVVTPPDAMILGSFVMVRLDGQKKPIRLDRMDLEKLH